MKAGRTINQEPRKPESTLIELWKIVPDLLVIVTIKEGLIGLFIDSCSQHDWLQI
jgi:hypothetical protein